MDPLFLPLCRILKREGVATLRIDASNLWSDFENECAVFLRVFAGNSIRCCTNALRSDAISV